ncbi:PREDICTED: uncharacterized protein LOC109163999 [Ipomoea nil]|uniref:uncharacterized protein LOC109163999 n=1 Tax=Ipomoea nil TaxID=35883 RepID=UPI00090150F8|nr:PREDICTED: uncharacterized protein LOC109163999 [Ipomoea nil]
MNLHNDVGVHTRSSNLANRQNLDMSSIPNNLNGHNDFNNSEDQETMELISRANEQQKEILFLREQIALASVRESQLLNDKYTLEKKFSELRMALDEKQSEAIASASNELARRKGDLEENLRLVNELKEVEDERYIFMSSMLGLLAEYGIFPRVANASTLTLNVKHLHNQLEMKIRTTHAKIATLNSMAANGSLNVDSLGSTPRNNQFPGSSMDIHGYPHYSKQYIDGQHSDVQGNINEQMRGLLLNPNSSPLPDNGTQLNLSSNVDRDIPNHSTNLFNGNVLGGSYGEMPNEPPYPFPGANEKSDSMSTEGRGPGIEGFQIIGDAKPGGRLLGCGYPVQGTSLCMFQWVRHNPDGTRHYIEGATNPEYVVTADDVDKLIAVECIPMDDQGRQGELVRLFANGQHKITCDADMQLEIDTHISNGQAMFTVLMLVDSSENWEPATLFLRQSSFQVKVHRSQAVVLAEKFSKDLSVKIPSGLSSQFVISCPDGSSHPFSTTNNDVRMRDALVLTMRIFQSKASDEKRKAKA